MILIIFGFLFYLFNELEDECVRSTWYIKHKKLNIWLNHKTSWVNKYKSGLIPYKFKWYHFGIYPKYEERFVYSSTLMVWITDGEHFFQLLKIVSIVLGICSIDVMLGIYFLIGVLIFSYLKEAFLKNIN